MIYFGTEIWGLVGAAAAWGITNIVVLFIATTAMHQRILKNESGRFICQVLVLPLIASCSVVLLVIFFVQGPTDGRLESLVIVFSSGVLALLVAMAALPNGRKLLKRLVQ
jgi:RsiW-degrading membrane proteinase PrsW (M82 family)